MVDGGFLARIGPGAAVAVLLEDNHLLAVAKPAGLLAQGDATGDPSLVELAADYLRLKYEKPGNVFIGLVHRLDRPVSGVVVLARTSKAASRLSRQFREGTVRKTYRAWAEGDWPEESGEWVDRLEKEAGRNVSRTVGDDPDDEPAAGKEARLSFRVLERRPGRTLFELEPRTGRSHQIRVQLATRGVPIVGDRKYGARSSLIAADGGHRIALHARSLSFEHPTRPGAIEVTAGEPADWPGSSGRR